MIEIFYYIIIGIGTGLLSGLLGVGGGIMTVPALVLILQYNPLFHTANTMHIAASTSLVTMAMTSTSSAYAYHRREALILPIFWRMLPWLCVGPVSGALLSHAISNELLIQLFALFLIGIAIYLFLDAKRSKPIPHKKHQFSNHCFSTQEKWMLILGSLIVGNLSTIFGVGGGILMVPLFLLLHCSMQEAAGTATLCGIISALVGSLLLSYLAPISKLPYTLGNIYWPAALFIGIASMICAPFGTRLAFYLKTAVLKQLFSGVLLIAAWVLFRGSMTT